MAVIDKIIRLGSSGKRVITGPAELVGPKANSQRVNFSSVTRITDSVDLYEITDGSGASTGSYTITLRPVGTNGLTARLSGIGRVAVVRQIDGVNTPSAAATVLANKAPANSTSSLVLGAFSVNTSDRLYVIVERRDAATIKYQLEVDRA
jgi:hypothetical protein